MPRKSNPQSAHRMNRVASCGRSRVGASLGRRLLRQAASKQWVVYSKAPMAGPAQVLRYLGRYTHRIAIGNELLVTLEEGRDLSLSRSKARRRQEIPHP